MNNKNIEKVCEEIKNPIDSFNIRKMIVETSVPFEWADNIHPINQLGYFYFGIADGFKFNEENINNAEELFLWKLYGLIQNYWLIHYREWEDRKTNLICNMRNHIKIEKQDIGKDMLSVYERYYEWR